MFRLPHILIAVVFFYGEKGLAQSREVDSLKTLIENAKDTSKVNLINKLSAVYWYIDPQETILYARKAIALSEELDFRSGLASAYNNTGVGYYQQNKYDTAIEWYNRAIEIHRQTGNFKGEANILSNIGLIYWKQGMLPNAVEQYLKSLKIWEDHNIIRETSSVFDNLGNVYNEQGDYDRALTYYFKARDIQKEYPISAHHLSMTLSNIGTAYMGKENYGESLKYFLASLAQLDDGEKESRAVSLSNVGLAYVELKDYAKANEYLEKALQLQKETGDSDGMIHTLVGLAGTSLETGNFKASKLFAEEALVLAQQINDKGVLAEIWLMLSNNSERQGEEKDALQYHKNYVAALDSVRNKEGIYKIAHLQAGFENEKKQAEIELLKKEREQQLFRRNTIASGLIALLIIAVLILMLQRVRIKKNNQLHSINEQLTVQSAKLEEQAKKLRELDQAKSTFFANISHEFRTPLTLILNSISDKIQQEKIRDPEVDSSQLEMMHRNARRLLQLINQLLDLSKLDAGHMKLVTEACNLNQLLKIVHASFASLKESRQIDFKLSLPQTEIICQLDTDKVEKVLYNLLSNAFKFTPTGGSISLSSEHIHDRVYITVKDSGRGIDKEELEQVFNRFYQGKKYYSDEQGTGIGLALTRELVELHGGKISVTSDSSGSEFRVELPLVTANESEENFTKVPAHIVPLSMAGEFVLPGNADALLQTDADKPTILVVEDNSDLRHYISSRLSAEFEVLESENGKTGLKKAIDRIPDLVITDWMMPEMDGITLCHHLKIDERTSHIPLIMLTALATDDARFKGLETGADEYLTKPFDNRELMIRVKNLIENRQRLRDKFSRELHLGPKKVTVSSMDEKFLEKVMQAIETHLGDPEFNMEKFGQQVGLSRMQLHRKLKALTGDSPGDFLRSMRLERAKRLLESKSGNVSEIAYEVGFNNLSYFSKCYRERFKIAPNETISAGVTNVSGNVT